MGDSGRYGGSRGENKPNIAKRIYGRSIVHNKYGLYLFCKFFRKTFVLLLDSTALIDEFFQNCGTQIYKGYVDDQRNTDNAWMETVAFNFHDESGKYLQCLKLEAGDDAGKVKWMTIDRNFDIFKTHQSIVKLVVDRLNAHW